MKDDIKEILEEPKILMLSYGNYISLDDYAKLKDYITNLQKEIEDKEWKIEHLGKIASDLQEKINQYENPDDMTLFYMWLDTKAKDKMKQLEEENKMYAQLKEEYEDIIDKAIEYIKDLYDVRFTDKDKRKLLEILQGEDNE